MYYLAERLCAGGRGSAACRMSLTIITNGLLLTEESSIGCCRSGCSGVKITLDGDRDTHNRMRPLRGGQGTFDRIIENIRRVAGQRAGSRSAAISTRRSVDSYPALLEFLREQEFADQLVKVNFKPIVTRAGAGQSPKGVASRSRRSGATASRSAAPA